MVRTALEMNMSDLYICDSAFSCHDCYNNDYDYNDHNYYISYHDYYYDYYYDYDCGYYHYNDKCTNYIYYDYNDYYDYYHHP